jgi:hypothetical protein
MSFSGRQSPVSFRKCGLNKEPSKFVISTTKCLHRLTISFPIKATDSKAIVHSDKRQTKMLYILFNDLRS